MTNNFVSRLYNNACFLSKTLKLMEHEIVTSIEAMSLEQNNFLLDRSDPE